MCSISNQKVKLEYLTEYWQDFTECDKDSNSEISYFKNLEQDSINPILYNPRELFKEFIDEIERKNLSNKDYKEFFMNNVRKLLELKLDALNFLKPTLTLITQEFNEKDFSHLLHVLEFALNEIDNFRIGRKCIEELAQIVSNDQELSASKETIKHLVGFIVFELQDKGFSDEKIHDMKDIGKVLLTELLQNFQLSKESKKHNKDLQDFIENIGNCFDREAFSAKFIFRIYGIRAEEGHFQMGDIEIYDPTKKSLIQKKDSGYDEISLGFSSSNKQPELMYGGIYNIAIKQDIVDGNSRFEKHRALLKVNSFIDCLYFKHFKMKSKISIDRTRHLVLNDNGKVIGSGLGVPEILLIQSDARPVKNFINKTEMSYCEKLNSNSNLIEIDKQIQESMAWKRRALEATNHNEAILWFWISMENLFNLKRGTASSIFDFAPKILTRTYIPLHYMEEIKVLICNKIDQSVLDIKKPKTLVEKAREICGGLDKNSFLYERIENFIKTFEYQKDQEDKKVCEEFIKSYEDQVRQKLIFLYRLRNKIAHDANSEHSTLTAYYQNFASYVSSTLISYFIRARINKIDNFDTNEKIVNYGTYEYSKMLLNLKKYGVVSIIDPKE